jgi:hypothetical protein
MYRCTNVQIYKCTDVQMYRCTNVQFQAWLFEIFRRCTQQIGFSCNASDLYSGSAQFETWSEHWFSGQSVIVLFFSPFRKILERYLKAGYDHLLHCPFQLFIFCHHCTRHYIFWANGSILNKIINKSKSFLHPARKKLLFVTCHCPFTFATWINKDEGPTLRTVWMWLAIP